MIQKKKLYLSFPEFVLTKLPAELRLYWERNDLGEMVAYWVERINPWIPHFFQKLHQVVTFQWHREHGIAITVLDPEWAGFFSRLVEEYRAYSGKEIPITEVEKVLPT